MLAPIKWLEEYTDINVGVQEFCDRLILSGSNLETVCGIWIICTRAARRLPMSAPIRMDT